MTSYCSDCGHALAPGARFCEGCGGSVPAEDAPRSAAGPAVAGGTPASASALPEWVHAVAPEIWAVTGLLVAVGLLLLVPALLFVSDAVRLMANSPGTVLTLLGGLFLAIGLELAAFGAILIYLARLVYLGDRVGRGLTLVVAGCTVAASFLGLVAGDQTLVGSPAGEVTGVFALLGALGVVAILFFAPRARAHFDRHDDRPVSVATASTLIAWMAVAGIIDGAILLGFAPYKASFAVYGVLFLIASFGLLGLNRQLRAGSVGARWGATAFALVYLVVAVLVLHGTFDYVQLTIGLAIIGLLWVPPEVEAHFGSRLALEKIAQSPSPQPRWQAAGAAGTADPVGYAFAPPQPAATTPPPAYAPPASAVPAACPRCAAEVGQADRFCEQCGAETGVA
jgi:hypothetical protein